MKGAVYQLLHNKTIWPKVKQIKKYNDFKIKPSNLGLSK